MSLVNEALKRARAEAEEREARRHGSPYPTPIPDHRLAPVRPRVLPILAVLGVVFLVGLLAGAITFVRNRVAVPTTRASSPGAPPPAQAASAPHAVVEPAAPPPGSADSTARDLPARSTPSATPPPAVPRPDRQGEAAPQVASRADSEPAPAARPVSAAPPPTRGPTAESSPEPTGEAGSVRSEIRNATARDGRVLALGGIAWSETGPFALINGRVVAAGERIEGFKVIEIQKEQVRLEDDVESIVLQLR